jgi:hypothetical protein
VNYELTTPCDQCPFLKKNARGYPKGRLAQYASGEFPCHKTAKLQDNKEGGQDFVPTKKSQHCAGALIHLEKKNKPHQMMRICERLGTYDRTKLNMDAKVV